MHESEEDINRLENNKYEKLLNNTFTTNEHHKTLKYINDSNPLD